MTPEFFSPTSNTENGLAFQAYPELQSALLPLARETIVPAKEDIFPKGAVAKGVYLLIEGNARLLILGDDGTEISSRTVGAGCILGLPATLCSTPHFFTARATEKCRIGLIETARLNDFLRERTDLCMQVVQIMSHELSAINKTRAHMRSCSNKKCALNGACRDCN